MVNMPERLIEIFAEWPPLGQAFFVFIVLGGASSFVLGVCRYVVILFRGWPDETNCNFDPEDWVDDDDE